MDLFTLMQQRHSVRQYTLAPIETTKREILDQLALSCSKESNLQIEIVYDEPNCFQSFLAHYGSFRNANNYIVIAGKKGQEVATGYYGEMLVLKAQELGLNTCWVALTKGKVKVNLKQGNKVMIVIALGYGLTQGKPHRNRKENQINEITDGPDWYNLGIQAAMLAPTALNQQKYIFSLKGDEVCLKAKKGYNTMLDLGIIQYHFEAITHHKVTIVK